MPPATRRVMAQDSSAISAQTAESSRTKAGEAEAALQLAKSQLATAQLNLERSTVRSPVNGFVTNLIAVVGNYATQGTGVLALVDNDSFYVYAYFMETKLPGIKTGDAAEVRLMAGGGRAARHRAGIEPGHRQSDGGGGRSARVGRPEF